MNITGISKTGVLMISKPASALIKAIKYKSNGISPEMPHGTASAWLSPIEIGAWDIASKIDENEMIQWMDKNLIGEYVIECEYYAYEGEDPDFYIVILVKNEDDRLNVILKWC